MNKTKIEWCDFTWNPQIGCLHGCNYCYAEKLHNQRHKAFKEGKKMPIRYNTPFNEPKFIESELTANCPKLPKERNRIAKLLSIDKPIVFVVSMGDLFGKWVDSNNITKIIKYVKSNPQIIFMFLTKNPERYILFDFPENAWLGATITNGEDYTRTTALFHAHKHNKTWISIEPLMGTFDNKDLNMIADFVIIGAMTGNKNISFKTEWVDSVNHKNRHIKNNLRPYFLYNKKYDNRLTCSERSDTCNTVFNSGADCRICVNN